MLYAFAHGQSVSGIVSDANGPLPGANVIVKGTTNGTTTDFNGNYTLNEVGASAILQISFVGYATLEVAVNGKSTINITLKEDANSLEEVVVVGYGSKKKSLVTGAISSIKSEDMQNNGTTRVEQAIQGKVSGISVLTNSGSPGAGSKIRIRGTGSNGNADPIYIVDGMKTYSIDNIDGGDIESIEILKDAASSAIYGTEGANGVVIVTTKSGRNYDKPLISYNSQFGVQSERSKMELMNESQYRTYLNEAGVQNIPSNGIDTNWLDEVFEDAWMEKHHLSFAGGTEKSTYLLSGSYTNQDGIVGGVMQKIQPSWNGISFWYVVVFLMLRGCNYLNITNTLGLFDSLVRPSACTYITSFSANLEQIECAHIELQTCPALKKKN